MSPQDWRLPGTSALTTFTAWPARVSSWAAARPTTPAPTTMTSLISARDPTRSPPPGRGAVARAIRGPVAAVIYPQRTVGSGGLSMTASVPALGREAELAALAALLDEARRGTGGALVVRGEPGVGKSLLLATVMDGAEDVTLLSATGVQSESDLAFGALSALLRPLLDGIDQLPAVQADSLRAAVGLASRGARGAAARVMPPWSACWPPRRARGRCSSSPTTCSGSTRRHATRSCSRPAAWTPMPWPS